MEKIGQLIDNRRARTISTVLKRCTVMFRWFVT